MPRKQTKKKTRYYIAALVGVFILLIAAATYFTSASGAFSGNSSGNAAVSTAPALPNPFDSVSIAANAAYVLDLSTGKILYQKNAQTALPLASITKLMAALVVLQHENQAGDAQTEVAIDQDSLAQAGDDGDIGLLLGERWNVNDLLSYSLISSSNVGTTALARGIFAGETPDASEANFIKAMNEGAAQLGLDSMSYYNPNGLDISTSQAGAYGSAQDVSKLMANLISSQRTAIGATAVKSKPFISTSGIRHTAVNTDEILGELPGLIASKTGFTALAGGNLVVAFDSGLNHPIVITVLGSTEEGRFTDVLALASTTMAYLAEQPGTSITQYSSTTPENK